MQSTFQVAVKAIFVNNNNQTLILKRSEYDGWKAGCWEFPGGRMAHGETIEEALQREILEETNQSIACINNYNLLFADTKVINQYIQNVYLFFIIATDSFTPQLSTEHTQFMWIPVRSISEYFPISDDQINMIKEKLYKED